MSFDRLIEKIDRMQNPTVAGLDPKLEYIPESIKEKAFKEYGRGFDGAAAAILEFNKGLIDALCDIVPAVKPQCAYYEMYGWQGVRALYETIAYAKANGMFIITDGKRNDIGSTMDAYASAHIGTTDIQGESMEAFGADALTVNAYLGADGINPLLNACRNMDKGIFMLVKTSNPSSGDLQDRILSSGISVYQQMGIFAEKWGEDTRGAYGYSAVGAVIGATYPRQLEQMRSECPHTLFLVPGYGAQGGGAKDIVSAFDQNGRGAVINSSRAIMCAYKKEDCSPDDYAEAARREAMRMREEIAAELNN